MTNNNPSGVGSTATYARDEAADVAEEAKDATSRVASTARDEVARVTNEAKGQGRQLFGQVRGELRQQAGTQQQRAAQGLHTVGNELRTMATSSKEPGLATELVDTLAGRADSVARWLEARNPESLVEEVKSFARRRPGVFIGVALGIGVVAGRLLRNIVDTNDNKSSDMSRQSGMQDDGFVSETPTFDRVVSETGTEALP